MERKAALLEQLNIGNGGMEQQKEQVTELLLELHEAFALDDNEIGTYKYGVAHLDTGTSPPIALPLRRTPFGKRAAIDEEIEKLLKMNIIEESDSEWAAAIVPVSKPDGSI